MRHWHISMTFEGYVDGETSSAAAEEFKAQLGLAPASRRSEVHLTGMAAREVDDAGGTVVPIYVPVAEEERDAT